MATPPTPSPHCGTYTRFRPPAVAIPPPRDLSAAIQRREAPRGPFASKERPPAALAVPRQRGDGVQGPRGKTLTGTPMPTIRSSLAKAGAPRDVLSRLRAVFQGKGSSGRRPRSEG
eukprot:RCo027628